MLCCFSLEYFVLTKTFSVSVLFPFIYTRYEPCNVWLTDSRPFSNIEGRCFELQIVDRVLRKTRKRSLRLRLPTPSSDAVFRRRLPTPSSDAVFRRRLPTPSSDAVFRRRLPTPSSDAVFRRRLPKAVFRRSLPTPSSDAEYPAALRDDVLPDFPFSPPRLLFVVALPRPC